ncbi:histidine kinase [Nitrospira sp.]|nr:histidine kinase [Nitrospira sp.]
MVIQSGVTGDVAMHVPSPLVLPSSAATPATSDTYATWRAPFASERLKVLYYLGLAANAAFILADFLLYREHVFALLPYRATIEIGFVLVLLALHRGMASNRPALPLIAWILIGNLCIAQMTVILDGFTSPYFNGLNLVFLAAAVIVPISWASHLAAHLVTLLYYYGVNLVWQITPPDINAAISNSFFLIWTSVACLFSVSLYERVQRRVFEARAAERRARHELEVSNEKLRDLDRLKSEFFANISHELRTPLTISLGAFRTLSRSELTKQSQQVVQSGLRNTSRLLFLINELLELTKFEGAQPTLKKACIDLRSLVTTVAANFELSERQRVFIENHSDPLPVLVDVKRMTKVVYNLCANAFKFSDPVSGNVWIRFRPQAEHVSFEIQDNGIGIPEDQLARIFDRFYQVEGDTARRYEGSGIGLALAKEIVTLHGGAITVRSTVGEGSTFIVTLPSGDASSVDLTEADGLDVEDLPVPTHADIEELQSDRPAVSDTNRPLILVADDSADMRAYLTRLLSDKYRVAAACNGSEALRKVRALKPALVVADMMMPLMSGDDLLKAVRADADVSTIPFIMLTARAGTEARSESFEAGADDYISKPFYEEELLSRVGNQLRIRQQAQELQSRAAELQQLYTQLESANVELQALSSRKSEFVSIVSHDLRTPLTAVTGFVDNLLDGIGGPLTDKQVSYLHRIKGNIWRLIRMVADLLDLAAIESGNVHFKPEVLAIGPFIDNLVGSLQPVAKGKGLRLDATGTDLEVLVTADPDKLTQVFTNLVHNACKFTPADGGVHVEIQKVHDGFVQVCVSDTGRGISLEELPNIFQKFYSGKTSSHHERGTGLGLAIAKHFVELHAGRIWVDSTLGMGSQFCFTIPTSENSAT